jgi:hypothetical protein
MSIIFSDEYPVVVLAFRVRSRGSTWLDGRPVGRIYVEKRDIKRQVWELIKEGRLTLDPEGRRRPLLVSVRGSGGFYAAILEDPERADGRSPRETRPTPPSMLPVTGYDEERHLIRLMEENRYIDFVELLEAYKPASKIDHGPDEPIHPMIAKTLATERRIHDAGPVSEKEKRTLLLLDRNASMAETWSLWERHTKITAAKFLANALAAAHPNTAVCSFGKTFRQEHTPDDVKPMDTETRLDNALRQAMLLEPESLVIITDGRPIRYAGVDAPASCMETAALLDALSGSGVQTLIFTLGKDTKMERLYSRLMQSPGIHMAPLKTGGDLVRMMKTIAGWL